MLIETKTLGQSGFRLVFTDLVVYVDPYLSNSVEIFHSVELRRLVPIPIDPTEIKDASLVLITHDHTDHCDPNTLPFLAAASPKAYFVGPSPVRKKLLEWGIHHSRVLPAIEEWKQFSSDLLIHSIPAAHPKIEYDSDGHSLCVGYLLQYKGNKLYLAGDTSPDQQIIDILLTFLPIHTAFLPVNEKNFFRSKSGIIGNMSVREAFAFAQELQIRNFVPVHWDMFDFNSTYIDEIQLIYKNSSPNFYLSLCPKFIAVGVTKVSIIIRTLNESRYLDQLLQRIITQEIESIDYEVVVVDSGSQDATLDIASNYNCKIVHIERENFSFGRSLNLGCEAASGELIVMISGHCVPTNNFWLKNLCSPIIQGLADYSYGRQIGGANTHFSENRIFAKYFLEDTKIPQVGYYCNNANSALNKRLWSNYYFDEDLTGLEDMDLARRMVEDGGKIAYVAEACVHHHHDESWSQIKRRFERESIALRKIMPQVHIGLLDFLRYTTISIYKDFVSAFKCRSKVSLINIVLYRVHQYLGTYKGSQRHRKLSSYDKEKYFYPK